MNLLLGRRAIDWGALGDDVRCRCKIFFKQYRRQRQNLSNRIEAITSIIRWKLLPNIVVHFGQLLDRFFVLATVQSPEDAVPWVDPLWIESKNIALNPMDPFQSFFVTGRLRFRRRHRLSANILPDRFPFGLSKIAVST